MKKVILFIILIVVMLLVSCDVKTEKSEDLASTDNSVINQGYEYDGIAWVKDVGGECSNDDTSKGSTNKIFFLVEDTDAHVTDANTLFTDCPNQTQVQAVTAGTCEHLQTNGR